MTMPSAAGKMGQGTADTKRTPTALQRVRGFLAWVLGWLKGGESDKSRGDKV